MAELNMSPGWDIYYHELSAFFAGDEDIHILYDREKKHIDLHVDNDMKASALDKLLVKEIVFGNDTLTILVISANEKLGYDFPIAKLFADALGGNDCFSFARTIKLLYSNPMTFVVFTPKVVQFHTDNIGDWNGFRSTLYQEIAKEIFIKMDGVFYCTDKASDEFVSKWL